MNAQNARDRNRGAIVSGFVLALIGGATLVAQLWPDLSRYIPFVLGVGLLGIFALTRAYAALVVGGILAGLGVGLLVSETLPTDEAAGAAVVLGLGTGFVSIWIASKLLSLREHHAWPLVPGGILVAVATGLTLDLFEGDLSRYVVPAAIALVGLLIMLGGYVRMNRTPA
jgi:hypothetical protein